MITFRFYSQTTNGFIREPSSVITKLAALILFLACSFSAHAYRLRDADVTVVNGVITQCTYDISSLGNIIEIPEVLDGQTITGLGDYCFQLSGKIKEVTLPATLKTIGISVFQNHNLTQVNLPEGITTIGGWAFDGNSIETVNLPNSILQIGFAAFRNNQIKAIQIPEGLTEIEGEVFCSNKIVELSIPKNITAINESAFSFNLIINLIIPKSILTIGESSFNLNNIESLIFEDGCQLTTIKGSCFSQNKLESIILPPNLKVIDRYAFANNYNLSSVIPNPGLRKIGKRAFSGCKLSTFNLPDGLIYLGSGAFTGNIMSSIELPNQNMGEKWTVSDGTTRNNGDLITNFDLSYIVRIPYTLKDDDVDVYNGFFASCSYTSNIENIGNDITIPKILDGQEIKEIGAYTFSFHHILAVNLPSALKIISYGAFEDCEINSLLLPASIETIVEYGFCNNNIRSITFETGSKLKIIDNYAFAFNKLIKISIPGSVSRIGRSAFSQNNVNSLIFEQPSRLTTIESDAFRYNNSLADFTLPEPVIEGYAYQGWLDGNDIIHQSTKNNLTVNDFSTYYRVLLSYTLTDDDVVVDKGVIISCSYDFTASMIIIPDTLDGQLVTGIGSYVFGKKGITNVTLPSKLKFIGDQAFRDNILSEITIPATTDSIAFYAFYNNYIKNILYEENSVIRIIGSNAFRSNRIDTLIIPNTIERIESEAFEDTKIEYLVFEDGSKLNFLGNYAFASNRIQHNLTIPPLLKEVGKFAFRNNSIGHITLHKNVTDIGEGAFDSNPTVTIDPLPTPETIPFTTWFIRWRDSDNNTLAPGYVITDFKKGYRALIDQYLNVKFQVYDDNGLALQGATIQFSDSLMVADALGRDSIAPVLRGVHNYVVSANGCLSQSASVDVQDDIFLQIILNRLYTFNVKVVDKNNNTLKNVHIEIGDSILQSNSQGEATLMLIDGNYACIASLPGYSIGSSNVEIHDADTSIIIQLNPSVITYYPNGGAESAYSENATSSTYQIQNNSFTRIGYSYTKWNTQDDGSGSNFVQETSITLEPGDLNLYAIWQLKTYQISYDLRGGQNDLANPLSYTINSNTIQLKPAIATEATEVFFEGWFDADGNKVESIPQGSNGDISLWASFIAEPSYAIDYQNVMNGVHSNPSVYTQNDLPLTFLQASQNGYNFLGWYSEITFNNKIESLTTTAKGDTSLYARWETISYNIVYELNGGTNSSQNPANYTIETSAITLQTATKQGYTFGGWFSDENFTQPVTSIPIGSTGNKTFYTKWILDTYTIDYVLNGGTNSSQNPTSYTFESSSISLLSASQQGYTFGGWFADENFTQPVTSISSGSTGNKTFYAKWVSLYLLTFEITTDGSTPAPGVSVIINNADPIITNNNGNIQLPCENDFQFTYRVVLDNIEITSGSGTIQSADKIVKVEIVNAYMRWYDVIFCDNGLQLWTDFEWQKVGQPISSEQFYHNEGGIETGQYTLIVTSQSGKQFSWTKSYQNNLFALSFYPNPVLKSHELTIEIKGFYKFDDCELLIYNSSGQVVHKNTQISALNHVQLNSTIREGIYLMVFTQEGKQLSAKQFIIR